MLLVKEKLTTKMLTKIAILSVISFIIMYIVEVPLWFTPDFLKMDFSDIPALIGAFALGPFAGVMIELVKNVLHIALKGTTTMGVGTLANFIVGAIFVYTAGIVYHRKKSISSAVLGMVAGTIAMSVIASVVNYVFLIPFYAKVYGMPLEAYVEMASAVNKYVIDFKSFIIYGIFPFNLFKGIVISLITLPLYKRISPSLHK